MRRQIHHCGGGEDGQRRRITADRQHEFFYSCFRIFFIDLVEIEIGSKRWPPAHDIPEPAGKNESHNTAGAASRHTSPQNRNVRGSNGVHVGKLPKNLAQGGRSENSRS